MALVKLCTPATDVERMTTVALLEGHGIRCFEPGGAFTRLYPGAQLGSRNALVILVEEEQLHEARLLLAAPPIWEEPPD
jgi:hypothetical protein